MSLLFLCYLTIIHFRRNVNDLSRLGDETTIVGSNPGIVRLVVLIHVKHAFGRLGLLEYLFAFGWVHAIFSVFGFLAILKYAKRQGV